MQLAAVKEAAIEQSSSKEVMNMLVTVEKALRSGGHVPADVKLADTIDKPILRMRKLQDGYKNRSRPPVVPNPRQIRAPNAGRTRYESSSIQSGHLDWTVLSIYLTCNGWYGNCLVVFLSRKEIQGIIMFVDCGLECFFDLWSFHCEIQSVWLVSFHEIKSFPAWHCQGKGWESVVNMFTVNEFWLQFAAPSEPIIILICFTTQTFSSEYNIG